MRPGNQIKVLVVEDSADDVFLLRRMFRKLSAPSILLHIEETLHSALRYLAENVPDVILLDIGLPDAVDHKDALLQISRAHPGLPIVVLTDADERHAELLIQLGAQDFLPKQALSTRVLSRALRHAKARQIFHHQNRQDDFACIVDSCPEGILVVDDERRVCYANQAANRMLAPRNGSLLGETASWISQDTKMFDIAIRREDEADGTGQVHISDTTWRGRIAEMVIIRDVTQHRSAEAALREHNQRVERVRRMESIGMLAGGVAHEFNNQLMVIQGFSELALDMLDDAPETNQPQRVYLDRVLTAARRSASITRQLMSMSRRPSAMPRSVSLVPLLKESSDLLRPLLGEMISLELLLEVEDAFAFVDPQELQQVVMNLAINARDAMPEGGVLELGLRQTGTVLELWIRDTGVGMSEETVARAFEPFFTTKGVGQGSGLGLSTVYGLVHRWGATVNLHSEEGVGTTATILIQPGDRTEATVPATVRHLLGHGERILVVEDELAVREYLRSLLEARGFFVEDAGSPAEVLSGPLPNPSLMLVDVIMPGMSGPKMVKELRARGVTAPVLYLSGYPSRRIDALSEVEELDRLLTKPIDVQHLFRRIFESLQSGSPEQPDPSV